MRPTASRPPGRRFAVLLGLVACAAPAWLAAHQAVGQSPVPPIKPLLVLPTEDAGVRPLPPPSGAALVAAQVAVFPLGLHFGMSPEAVNASLAHPLPSVAPSALAVVPYLGPDTVVGFSIGMVEAGNLKPAITACFGPTSEIVIQFDASRLYALSFRFARDGACPDVSVAADQLYQRLLAIPPAAMPSEHYRVGAIEVVDAWDPTVTSVVRQRWHAQ